MAHHLAGPQKDGNMWITRWRTEISSKPTRPGIWKRRDGGYLARVQVRCPKTGKMRDLKATCPDVGAALAWQSQARKEVLSAVQTDTQTGASGAPQKTARTRFGDYSVCWLEGRIMRGELRSEATKQVYGHVLRCHLIPTFGDLYLNAIAVGDVKTYREGLARAVTASDISPRTANHRVALLREILRAAVEDGHIVVDRYAPNTILSPSLYKKHDTSTKRTYTREQPNSLTAEEIATVLDGFQRHFPNYYALFIVGLSYALRPSSLRPLRWRGENADVLWQEKRLLIRRSHSRGQVVMNRTKTGEDLDLPIPDALLTLLRSHVATYCQNTDLLFPGRSGRLMNSQTILTTFQRLFTRLRTEGKWGSKRITPRAMRRSFYNLVDRLGAGDTLARSISGHRDPKMRDLYSTPMATDQAQLIGAMVEVARGPNTRANHPSNHTPDSSPDSSPISTTNSAITPTPTVEETVTIPR